MNTRLKNKSSTKKQLLIFLGSCYRIDDENHNPIEHASFETSVRTSKHALRHMREFDGKTTALMLDDASNIASFSEDSHNNYIVAAVKEEEFDAMLDIATALEDEGAELSEEPNQYSKAMIFGDPYFEFNPETIKKLKGVLERNLCENALVRVQICEFMESGILETIPKTCRVSIPEEWSIISPHDTRSIDISIDSVDGFDYLKIRLAQLLKANRSLNDLKKKLCDTIDKANTSFHKKKKKPARMTRFRTLHDYDSQALTEVKYLGAFHIWINDDDTEHYVEYSQTTLDDAAKHGKCDFIQSYLEGVTIGRRNIIKYLLLPIAIAATNKQHEACKLLINKLSEMQLKYCKDYKIDSYGLTLVHVAALINDDILLEKLIDYGHDINGQIYRDETDFDLTPLSIALIHENMRAVHTLTLAGARIPLDDLEALFQKITESGRAYSVAHMLARYPEIENNKQLLSDGYNNASSRHHNNLSTMLLFSGADSKRKAEFFQEKPARRIRPLQM